MPSDRTGVRERTHEWQVAGFRHERLVEIATGKIVGNVTGEWRSWHASCVRPLGSFTELHFAKRAVERALLIPEIPNA